MKIAIPVKTNKEEAIVSPLFGKAKYFAIVEDKTISIMKNEQSGGQAVIQWLYNMGVNTIMAQELGINPYMIIKKLDMILYHAGFERISVKDLLWKLDKDLLTILNDRNIQDVINHHEKKHPSHDENHHHH